MLIFSLSLSRVSFGTICTVIRELIKTHSYLMIAVGFAFAVSFLSFISFFLFLLVLLLLLHWNIWLSNHFVMCRRKIKRRGGMKERKQQQQQPHHYHHHHHHQQHHTHKKYTFSKWIEIRKFIACQNTLINFITAMKMFACCLFRAQKCA